MNLQREQMLKNIIRQHDLGALVFWRPDELVITCGYFPLWGLSFLVYTEDDAPVLFVPELEPEDILPKDMKVEKYPWGLMDCADPWEILINMIKAMLVKKNVQRLPVSFIKNIGGTAPCMMSGEQPPLPADLIDRLSALTAGGFNDATQALLDLYAYKTEADVQCLRRTHKIAAIAVETFYENLRPGISEAALAGLIEYAVQSMTGSEGIHFSKAWPMILSGRNAIAGGKYNRSTGKKLQQGEMVMLEMAICVNGYWADITRTGQTSEISEQQNKIFNTVLEAQQKAIAMMKPGVLMADIDAAARQHIEDAGLGACFNHALGHHVGFRYHDIGPSLSPGSAGVLREGMLLTVEPGIYGEAIGCGARIEDNILITKDGFEILSNYPRMLAIKEV
ncbi:M24 family metallopeptidase [Chitinophaga sp. Ak27]|uniref:M24 family metallopeptidase n=1 Tax=Chitinophaga sp. Ak27 TaxID=2726116 RepID=UPI00145CB43E|nr:Xaa-Pro peptidase family protein [Chitinophaga sp. Ak27]NLU90641.1 aminopeptidase P family protein [Chitinophaga sp. Ak27]